MTRDAEVTISSPELVQALAAVVGDQHVLTDPALVEPFCVDWARRFSGPCLAVVRPGSTDEVAAVMRVCSSFGVPVLPQGGNTSLVGGSVPAASGPAPVIVSVRRLASLGDVDPLSGQMTVGAGALLGDVQRHAAAAGWSYGVDLAARDSATIGGTVATNAGGIHVIRNGMTRAQVTGIEAVMPDGSVISHLEGLLKDNTGYDLASLLCGSEGTLGIITAVRLRLHRPVGRTSVALVGVPSYSAGLDLIGRVSAAGSALLAAEVLDESGMERVMDVSGAAWPLAARWPVLVLVELIDGGDGSGFMEVLDDDADAVLALEPGEQARLWEFRERQSEAYSALGVAHKLDVSVALPVLAACADELHALVAEFPSVRVFGVFGHLADGNIHLEIIGPEASDDSVTLAVLECVARYGGSISAEHGVGRAKAAELHLCRSAAEISAMKAIKAALDPQGLMNPGVVFA